MDRIFIPTVNRVKQQTTFEGLPKSLQKKVTLVVQHWERSQYKYDCDYLVLPKNLHYSDHLCLSKSRKIIYEEGRKLKYCVLDDDLTFHRRNQRRFDLPSDMEKSGRKCTDDDLILMFDTFNKWLDDPTVTFCGWSSFLMTSIFSPSSFFQNVPEKFIDKFDRTLFEQIKQKSPKGSWNIYLIDKDKLVEYKMRFDKEVLGEVEFDPENIDYESDDPFGLMLKTGQSDDFYFLKTNHIKFKVEEWVRMSFVPEQFGKFDFQSPYGLYLKSSRILLREYSDHETM